jgi:hypothetical protein
MIDEKPFSDTFHFAASAEGRRVRIDLKLSKSFELEEIRSMQDGVSRAAVLAAVRQALNDDTWNGGAK